MLVTRRHWRSLILNGIIYHFQDQGTKAGIARGALCRRRKNQETAVALSASRPGTHFRRLAVNTDLFDGANRFMAQHEFGARDGDPRGIINNVVCHENK